MLGKARLIRGFLVVLAGAFVVIAGAQLLKGNTVEYAVSEGLLWSLISAVVFTVARVHRWRKGQYCAACGDVPPLRPADGSGNAAPPYP
jgi:hypothetical protein